VVEKNAEKKGNKYLAQGYVNFLYSPLGQEISARHFYRPRNATVLKKYSQVFKPLKLVSIDQEFGGWTRAQKIHFENGGIFDRIVKANSAH
jgi:sulfate transport system substrate-binding protein